MDDYYDEEDFDPTWNISEWNDGDLMEPDPHIETGRRQSSTVQTHQYNFELFMDPNTGKQRYKLPKKWEASSHYSKTLRQVRQQVTPAGQYREYYKAFGREEAVIRLLDRRIDPEVDKCRTAVIWMQARHRGWKGRQYFLSIRDALIDARTQLYIRRDAMALFRQGDKRASLDTILRYRGPALGLGLYVMKCKLFYSLGEIAECMRTARELIAIDHTNVDGHYLLACCLVSREQYEAAFQLLSTLFSESSDATQVERIVRLNGFICTKVQPPRFSEAVENFDFLVQAHPEDMNSYLQRACCFMSLQQWDKAVADYSYILDYQPHLTHVVCLRARAYTCMRQWGKAKADYTFVIRHYPEDTTAAQGLAEMSQAVEQYPMNIPDR